MTSERYVLAGAPATAVGVAVGVAVGGVERGGTDGGGLTDAVATELADSAETLSVRGASGVEQAASARALALTASSRVTRFISRR